jgi:hypothetical protein
LTKFVTTEVAAVHRTVADDVPAETTPTFERRLAVARLVLPLVGTDFVGGPDELDSSGGNRQPAVPAANRRQKATRTGAR